MTVALVLLAGLVAVVGLTWGLGALVARLLVLPRTARIPGPGTAPPSPAEPGTDIRSRARPWALPARGRGTVCGWTLGQVRADAPTFALIHGYRDTHQRFCDLADALVARGAACLLPDLPSHGASTGWVCTYGATEVGVLQDAARQHVPDLGQPLIAVGHSMGGSIAIQWAAHDPRVRAVVALGALGPLDWVLEDFLRRRLHLPRWPVVPLAMHRAAGLARFDPAQADTVAAAGRLSVPLLLVHGRRDVHIPARHPEAIQRAAGGLAETWWVDEAGHFDLIEVLGPCLADRIVTFLSQHGLWRAP